MKTALPLWKPNARLCNKENTMYQKLAKTWAGLLFGFIALLLPLYIPKNGYYDIGEEKFKFFLCGMSILTLVGMLLFLFAVFQKKKVPFHFNSMDIFAILCLWGTKNGIWDLFRSFYSYLSILEFPHTLPKLRTVWMQSALPVYPWHYWPF